MMVQPAFSSMERLVSEAIRGLRGKDKCQTRVTPLRPLACRGQSLPAHDDSRVQEDLRLLGKLELSAKVDIWGNHVLGPRLTSCCPQPMMKTEEFAPRALDRS